MLSTNEYRAALRSDFMTFIERSFYDLNPQTRFVPGPHLEVIASKLEACRLGHTKRLIICLPPRHLKSHCSSIAFVAWCLAHDPAIQIICASYGQDLADKLARDCRQVMLTPWFKRTFATRLAGQQAVHDFMTTERGVRMSTSVGGVLTGRGADLILIDDPLKPEEALSATRRGAVNDWYDNTLVTRLNDKRLGGIILIMQRLHQDDLVGHVLEQEDWDVVSFPAIAELDEEYVIDTPFGMRRWQRQLGEPLHAARESLETLRRIRQTIGEYNFTSQYQQNPMPPGGAMIKAAWLRYYEVTQSPQRFLTIIQSWDTANKAGELNDYSVCTTWGVLGSNYFLLDVFRRRLNYPELKRAAHQLAKRFHPQTVLIEDKASGTQLIQDLRFEGLLCVKPYKPPPGADKVMRLHAQTALFENCHVLLPHRADWLEEYVAELTGFPGSRFDDQVDSTTQALDHLRVPSGAEFWARFGRAMGRV